MTRDHLKTASLVTKVTNIGADSDPVHGSVVSPIICLSLVLALSACNWAIAAPQMVTGDRLFLKDARAAFSIALPDGCDMNGQTPVEDFSVFQIACGGTPKVGMYVGNHSNFGNRDLTTLPDVAGREVIVNSSSQDGKIYGYLWKTQFDWPSQLHIWLHEGQEDDAVARAIAESIRPTDPKTIPAEGFYIP